MEEQRMCIMVFKGDVIDEHNSQEAPNRQGLCYKDELDPASWFFIPATDSLWRGCGEVICRDVLLVKPLHRYFRYVVKFAPTRQR